MEQSRPGKQRSSLLYFRLLPCFSFSIHNAHHFGVERNSGEATPPPSPLDFTFIGRHPFRSLSETAIPHYVCVVAPTMAAVAYLVVANPSAKNNLGTLIRCAAAFSVEEVVVVGSSKWSTHGAHGSNKVQSQGVWAQQPVVLHRVVTFGVLHNFSRCASALFIHGACLVGYSCATLGGKAGKKFEFLQQQVRLIAAQRCRCTCTGIHVKDPLPTSVCTHRSPIC